MGPPQSVPSPLTTAAIFLVGRTKLTNIELDDAVKPADSHVALTTIKDPDGTERRILRDNMPFGAVGKGSFSNVSGGIRGAATAWRPASRAA